MGLDIEFLDRYRQDLNFIQVAVHDCQGCITLNFTLLGFHVYIGWMKKAGMDALRGMLDELIEKQMMEDKS